MVCINGLTVTCAGSQWFHRVFPARTPRTALAPPPPPPTHTHTLDNRCLSLASISSKTNMFKPVSNFLTGRSKMVPLWGSFLIICVSCQSTVLSVPYSLVVTCWEKVDLLALLFVMWLCFCHFPKFPMWCPGSGVVFVWIPDLWLHPCLVF